MPPWLANAIDRLSGDQFSPVLPPAVVVSGVGHPPSDGINAIWPRCTNANCLPSGDSTGLPSGSTEARSSTVIRARPVELSADSHAADTTAISETTQKRFMD